MVRYGFEPGRHVTHHCSGPRPVVALQANLLNGQLLDCAL